MCCLSGVVLWGLCQANTRLHNSTTSQVTVLTELRHSLAVQLVRSVLGLCLPVVFRQLVCPVPPLVSIVWTHCCLVWGCNLILIAAAMMVVKQVLVHVPGWVEDHTPSSLARTIFLAVSHINLTLNTGHCIKCLVLDQFPNRVAAYWSNIRQDSNVANLPAIWMGCVAGLSCLVAVADVIVNMKVTALKFSRLKSLLAVGLLMGGLLIWDNFGSSAARTGQQQFPAILLGFPFAANYFLIDFLVLALEQEEAHMREERAKKQLFVIRVRPIGCPDHKEENLVVEDEAE